MKPGDIVIGAFPGAQVTKSRPAVVLSTEDYHRHRPDVIVGVITTQTPNPLAPTDCALIDWKQAGLHTRRTSGYFQLLPTARSSLIGRQSDSDWESVRTAFERDLVATSSTTLIPFPVRYASSNNAARAVADSLLDLGCWISE